MKTMRNPQKDSHRQTLRNQVRTQAVIEEYEGKKALLATWEATPDEVQIRNHDYIIKQRAKVRMLRQMILHRAGPDAEI